MTRAKGFSSVADRSMRLRNATIAVQVLFLAALSVWLITRGVFPTLELLFLLTALLLLWRARERRLLMALLPFFLLLISYQILRGFADDLSPSDIHITDLIAWEKALFGGIIPAWWVQSITNRPAILAILNPIMNVVYMAHFVYPLIMAIALWYTRREYYWPFVLSLIVLSYAGFVTYLLFPAAPPWWATEYGFLVDQPVTLSRFAARLALELSRGNPVAAMPSLHCAYPALYVASAVEAWGRKGWFLVLLLVAVSFSTLYLGHHYVIDIIAGIAYGVIAHCAVRLARLHTLSSRESKPGSNDV